MMDLKNKNILFLCSWYPARVCPNNGNFIFKHARSLVKQSISITALAVYEDTSMSRSIELEEGEVEGVKHLIVYYKYPFRWMKYIYKVRAYFKGIQHLNKRVGGFDLIHVNVLFDAGFIARWIHFWKKTPYVITEHSSLFSPINAYRFPKKLLPLIKNVLKNAAYVMPVSRELGRNLRKIEDTTPHEVIPNVVDTELFIAEEKTPRKKKVRFLHISNFDPLKNVDGILRAVKNLSGQRRDFVFTIAGDGDIEEEQSKAMLLDIPEEVVQFQGKMSEKEVAEIFSRHDVFVLFSNYENLPCVLVEAQVGGLVIIATDVGGVAEIVNSEKFGALISPKDEKQLLEKMDKMIDEIERYRSSEISEMARSKYSENTVAQTMMEVYRKVLEK